jgi:transposase-like protein
MKKRKVLSGEQKTIILRELLDNKVPISDLSEKSDIHTTDIYNWKKN